MMYTKKQFGKELKERIKQQQDVADIGSWSYSMYSQHRREIDMSFRDFLLDLSSMESGPEFEYSYGQLNEIADRLIVGEGVKL